jgi:hypothetical protein
MTSEAARFAEAIWAARQAGRSLDSRARQPALSHSCSLVARRKAACDTSSWDLSPDCCDMLAARSAVRADTTDCPSAVWRATPSVNCLNSLNTRKFSSVFAMSSAWVDIPCSATAWRTWAET